jgi:UDP-sugar pyrophosphorylase
MDSNKNILIQYLKDLNQNHILDLLPNYSDEEIEELKKQIDHLEKIYPGGIKEYIKRSKILLENSKNNVNPYSSFTPSVPEGIQMTVGNQEFYDLEKIGIDEIAHTGFVLVAGGLGERLGYNDIKIGIQTDLVTERVFIEVYIQYLLAYEKRIRKLNNIEDPSFCIPLCIMTSDDTHIKTIKLLEENNYYGYKKENLSIVKQEKVPALLNNDCHMSLEKGRLIIDTKPHGHGDVHTLLFQNGVVEKWQKMNKKWVVFFQDTNILVFNCIPSAIGVAKRENYVVNSITIPRKPGDAVGAICKLTNQENKSITLNVEYNQLDSLLRDKWNPSGDISNESGFSFFPGNINVLIFNLDSYFKTLEKTKGLMPEFVNPKYADESKTIFKSPTRLECMMQDYPLLLQENERVGFTMYQNWFCFSTCKNNLKDGTDRLKKGLMAETSFSLEQDIFNTNIKLMSEILNKMEIVKSEEFPMEKVIILGSEISFGPKIIVFPDFATCLTELKNKLNGKISLTNYSTLILVEGENIKNLNLHGYLRIENSTEIKDEMKIENSKRINYIALEEGKGENYETVRGYKKILKE